jgi:hypothetical protein
VPAETKVSAAPFALGHGVFTPPPRPIHLFAQEMSNLFYTGPPHRSALGLRPPATLTGATGDAYNGRSRFLGWGDKLQGMTHSQRYPIGRVVILVWLCVLAHRLPAQEIAFRGSDLMTLAHTLAVHARTTSQLPPAVTLPMTAGPTMTLHNANIFELFVRAIAAWKTEQAFPAQVPLLLDDLSGPTFDPKLDPARLGLLSAVPTSDLGTYAPAWLAMLEAPGHRIPKAMTFETGIRLTAAQLLVAMAVLIDETRQRKEFPPAVVVPLVQSPKSWQETRTPLAVATPAPAEVKPPPPPVVVPEVRILINGAELSEKRPMVAPFCGAVRIEMSGTGPIASIVCALDRTPLTTYQGVGPHTLVIESQRLIDGPHTLAISAVDAAGKSFAYIFSFHVQNGRISGRHPVERAPAPPAP